MHKKILRINAFLAASGVSSRRSAEKLVLAGRVKVNGIVVQKLATQIKVDFDKVEVDNVPIKLPEAKVTYAINKPQGLVSTVHDELNRPTIMKMVPKYPRVFPVGRLDQSSEGLMLLTNDGDLSLKLTHPKYHVVKVYEVLTDIRLNYQQLGKIKSGQKLKNYRAKPAEIELIGEVDEGYWYRLNLHEGKNRQVRRMMMGLGAKTLRLKRVQIGALHLNELGEEDVIQLNEEQLKKLQT
jgi:pseudouridine synthase